MSQPASSNRSRGRDLVFVVVGALLIVSTYFYLVVAKPVEIQEGLGQSSFIAMAGYTVGALLIAVGTIHRLPTTTVILLPVAIAVNIVIGQIATSIGLPVYLDSIGTILVGVLAGPAAGAVTGGLGNVIWGTFNPVSLPFAVAAVVIGVLAGYAARIGVFRRMWPVPIAGLITGVVAAVVSAPISAFVFGGATGGGRGALVGAFRAAGQTLLASTTLQGFVSDPLDKVIAFVVVAVIVAALPRRFKQRFPYVREFNVFGGAAAVRAAPRVRGTSTTMDGEGPATDGTSPGSSQEGRGAGGEDGAGG